MQIVTVFCLIIGSFFAFTVAAPQNKNKNTTTDVKYDGQSVIITGVASSHSSSNIDYDGAHNHTAQHSSGWHNHHWHH